MNNICNKINNKFWHDAQFNGVKLFCLIAKKAHKVLMNTHSSVLFLLILYIRIICTYMYILRKMLTTIDQYFQNVKGYFEMRERER